jgi:nucleotide-binding universal stress UspA family protein
MSAYAVRTSWLSRPPPNMLLVMNKYAAVIPSIDHRPRGPASKRPNRRAHRRAHRPPPQAGTEPGPPGAFSSVLCAADTSANSRAAYDQAVLLASPSGTVERVPRPELTRHGHRALHDACDGHDLLALGADGAASAAVQHAPIPVLIARWCPLGIDVTDTILVPVDDSPEASRAVAFAGRIAAAHGGTVTILRAAPRDPALQRTIDASGRVLLETTGAAPRHYGEQLPREHAIPSAATALTASLVVLGCGSSEPDRRMTAQIAGAIGCSVLVVPTLEPIPARRFMRDALARSES